jgi:predicted AAA+ superfamily ATPase
MIRYIIEELYRWKQNPARKPLVLQGARQVGKTWLMQQFAREAFPRHIYINF